MRGPSEAHVTSPVKILVGILAIIAFCGVGSRLAGRRESIPESVEPSLIANYHLVRSDLAAGGEPTEAGLHRLRDLGFRVVVDLRLPTEETSMERAAVESSRLRYVSVPVSPETFSMEDVNAVAHEVDAPGRGPLLLHCISGNRAGGVWTVLQVMKGRTLAEAENEGREIGLGSPAMLAAVRRVLGEAPLPADK
jgi:uncharacterized protein (TIGR01244 family)